jgi:hypothetical protein
MTEQQQVSIPGRLIGALVVLALQILSNGFLGWVLIDELNEDADHGRTVDGAGLYYFVGYLSVVVAVVLLVCAVLTLRPQAWVRPVIITIEALAIISGVINLVNGAVLSLVGIALAITVIAVMMSEDARDWYQR